MDNKPYYHSTGFRLISYPGWTKADYIKSHGKQYGSIAWVEHENRELKSEMRDMKDAMKEMEKRLNLLENSKF